MRLFLSLLLLLLTGITQATNFYVDASTTSATQNGSLSSPWKTLSQVYSNRSQINAGDFISFKRGGTYPGQLIFDRSGTAANPITFNAYGTGNAPIFSGTGSAIWYLFYLNSQSYVTFDGLNITDPGLSISDHSQMARIQRVFYLDGNSNHITIKKCDISLVGIGAYLVGSYNTMDSCTVQNLRMVVNTNNGGYDDYGANPLVITSSNNRITNNRFLDCWAPCYDFTYDGGAIEFYGDAVNNNFIGYNTMINNNGLIEIASNSSGVSNNNTFAYNKLINNGNIFFIHNQTTSVNNLQFYNNVVIETVVQRVYDNYLGAMFSSSSSSGIVVMKNNIFWLNTGIDVVRSSQFTGSQMTHENNIYKLGAGSVLNFNQNTTEITTTATNLFTNTTSSDPSQWNLVPVSASPVIDFGQNVGIARDFVGNIVPTVPNAGLYETSTSPSSTLSVSTTTPAAISCNGGSTSITVTATGGTAPYTGTGTFSVTAGTYTYTIIDATGNIATKTITVSQPAAINTIISAGTIAAYAGTTNLSLTALGGTGIFTYKLNNGAYQASNVFSSVAAGNHTVTAKDANGCTSSNTYTLLQPGSSSMIISATVAGINCFGETTNVSVTATGGTAPYTGTGNFNVGAGTYTYTINDAAYSYKTKTVSVTQPALLSANVTAGTINIAGGTTSLTVSATGGTAPYSYKLNNGAFQSSATFSSIIAGTYSVTIKDAKGCLTVKSVTIAQPSVLLTATATAGSILCNGGSTTVNVTASGGVSPYTGTGSFTKTAGTYNFTVTDAIGATKTVSVTINQPTALSMTLTAAPITIAGGLTSINVAVTGGAGSYQYKKNSGSYQVSNVLGNISAGTYKVTVLDANGCTMAKNITIADAAQSSLAVSATAGTIACNAGTTTVSVTATGGLAPYSGTGNFTVTAGTYTYNVTDATGTTRSRTVTVTQPSVINATLTAGTISVSGGTTNITTTASGGTAPYSYKLNNGAYQLSATFNGVAAGTYNVTIKDARNCTVVKSVKVNAPQSLQIILVSKADNSCRFTWDGSITVGATGGTAPYMYQINNFGYGATATFINLAPGVYTLYAKDATGTISSLPVTILASNVVCTGKNEIFSKQSTSTQSLVEDFEIQAYPNPTSSVLYLNISNALNLPTSITVCTMQGKVVEQLTTKASGKFSLCRSIAAGVYIVKVQQAEKNKIFKVVKTN